MGNTPAKSSIPQLVVSGECPVDVAAVCANQLLVQIDENECRLSFFEIPQPLFLDAAEGPNRSVAELKSASATCVARVVISKERLQEFVDDIQAALQKPRDISVFGSPLVAVLAGDQVQLVERLTAENMDDLAAIEEANESGASTSYAAFRKELDLT
jgi:hypothetical protein